MQENLGGFKGDRPSTPERRRSLELARSPTSPPPALQRSRSKGGIPSASPIGADASAVHNRGEEALRGVVIARS